LYRKFLNARSPLRILEQGLHGGLGPGNIGIFLAGHGVGKGSVLIGVALDELKLETEAGLVPSLVIIDGADFDSAERGSFEDFKALAVELAAEIWLSAQCKNESPVSIPESIARLDDLVSVIVALEPGEDAVALRALKDHDNPDTSDLHVALDPRTLLLKRN
jgi:hypothetical protein